MVEFRTVDSVLRLIYSREDGKLYNMNIHDEKVQDMGCVNVL